MAVFDTLRAARTLRAAGFEDAKAEAVAEVVQAVANGNRVTRADMQGVAMKVDLERFATKEDLKGFATKKDLERFATKEDLKGFATKKDLERFATKEDLKGFATKEDLKRFATKADLERFATKEDLERFATKADLESLAAKAALKSDLQDLELRLTIRLGVVAAASVTLTTALVVGINQLLL